MKSMAELEAIRQRTLQRINLRKEDENENIRVVIGMATCGIAAGARPVMMAFMDEINKRGLSKVTVSQTGCIGMCRLEPMVDVYLPGTVVALVTANPEKPDFLLECSSPKGEMSFDTREVRQALGDVPLNEPEIAAWMLEAIREELEPIFGGVIL